MSNMSNALTEININELVKQKEIGIPFAHITIEEIEQCLNQKIFLETHNVYNENYDAISYHKDKSDTIHLLKMSTNAGFDLLKIATIVNEINNGTYNYQRAIRIWDDNDDYDYHATPIYDTDGEGHHHIRAFYYCKRNIRVKLHRSKMYGLG